MESKLFKRSFLGYAHFIAFEALFIYRGFFDPNTEFISKVFLAVASLVVAVLLLRFIFMPYIKIENDTVKIFHDLFYSNTLKIESIIRIEKNSNFFSYSLIVLENEKKIKFNESYLSKDQKAELIDLLNARIVAK